MRNLTYLRLDNDTWQTIYAEAQKKPDLTDQDISRIARDVFMADAERVVRETISVATGSGLGVSD